MVKRALGNFISKWYKHRNFNLQIRNIDCMYYHGCLVRDIPQGYRRPNNVERAIAEISLAMGYVDWSEMTPMKRNFLAVYNLMKQQCRGGIGCTYHAVAGFYNKYYDNGTEENIMMNAVDEASVYFLD